MSDKVKTDEYLSYLKDRLDIDIDNILLKKIICSMLNGIDHTIFNLTAQLSTKYKLACYTNTHKIHWDYINQHYNILDIFDKKFSSHITGILKPDPMVFPYIENELPADSSDILFIDDTIKNVEAAEQHGWNVIHHQSTKSTISSLKTFLHNN